MQNLLNASLYPHVQSYTLPASTGELCVCQDGTVVCFGMYVQVFEPREPFKIPSQKNPKNATSSALTISTKHVTPPSFFLTFLLLLLFF